MNQSTQAALALEPNQAREFLTPTCRYCAEFLGSERTPSVGNCLLEAMTVLAQDKACSQYYQAEIYEPVSSTEEF